MSDSNKSNVQVRLDLPYGGGPQGNLTLLVGERFDDISNTVANWIRWGFSIIRIDPIEFIDATNT